MKLLFCNHTFEIWMNIVVLKWECLMSFLPLLVYADDKFNTKIIHLCDTCWQKWTQNYFYVVRMNVLSLNYTRKVNIVIVDIEPDDENIDFTDNGWWILDVKKFLTFQVNTWYDFPFPIIEEKLYW